MMDVEVSEKLRKKFARGAVGILPKPFKADAVKGNCRECGGFHGLPAAHLDFVGHAAVTDRLLNVDPGWSWEPFAVDERGLPALDSKGNLWIRLTVGGVTRIGVGDGKSAKEVIGDAVRNAAMRFGVALDLWSKNDLDSDDVQGQQPPKKADAPADDVPAETRTMQRATPTTPSGAVGHATRPQVEKLNIQIKERGITDRAAKLKFISARKEVNRPLTSSSDLTVSEASKLIDALDQESSDPTPAAPPADEPTLEDEQWPTPRDDRG